MGFGWKLFRVSKRQKGKIFPLYVNATTAIPVNEWVHATPGELIENGKKVKSRLGPLAFRPGFHMSDHPIATHMGVKGQSGKIEYMRDDAVWCYCEYNSTTDYTEQAKARSTDKRQQCLKELPENGFYRYKTNPTMFEDWIITSDIKVLYVASDKLVYDTLELDGITPMLRPSGEMNLENYGFVDLLNDGKYIPKGEM